MISIIVIILGAVLDITLTHYQLFLDKKKGVLDMDREKNLIPRLIMGKNPNPKNYVVGVIFTAGIFGLIAVFGGEMMRNVMLGMILVVNFYHLSYISDIKKVWDNKKYWKILKRIKKCK